MNGIAVFPPGLEVEGSKELIELGAHNVCPLHRCASFHADEACFYRLLLQARLPFRLLREMARFKCNKSDELYQGIQRSIDWEFWLHPSMSFRVDISGSNPGLRHSHYSALQVKNAIVDFQRKIWGFRSDISLEDPDFCFHLHLSDHGAILSLDGSSSSLHRRGYRPAMGEAPLKENLAAGLIRLTGWDGTVPLIDPVCGSGTFLIEAASLMNGLSPRLNRKFIIENWLDFNLKVWNDEKIRAQKKVLNNKPCPEIIGFENDAKIANEAKNNISLAGFQSSIQILNGHFRSMVLPSKVGTIVCNPPYGKRIGSDNDLSSLYNELGAVLKEKASGWQLWLLSGNPILTKSLRMKASKKIPVSNGGIDCRWLNYLIN
tara:strand:+ start:65 stop:1189 length:1125 start_codon:yes stop_codon:yes gene_type:complete